MLLGGRARDLKPTARATGRAVACVTLQAPVRHVPLNIPLFGHQVVVIAGDHFSLMIAQAPITPVFPGSLLSAEFLVQHNAVTFVLVGLVAGRARFAQALTFLASFE